ncbi:MAG: type III pantothenate kinase [Firmicutes bacterium]|nr:type III pantothenate kinase [Bacillota bacterium]
MAGAAAKLSVPAASRGRPLVAVNVGNTRTTVALVGDGPPRAGWRLASERRRTADEYAALLGRAMAALGPTPADVEGVAVACVVPPLADVWREVSLRLFDRPAWLYGDGGWYGIEARLDMPLALVGADRLCNAVAARALIGAPVLVVDVGTATTLDVVGPDGRFAGGAIAPGPDTAAQGLAEAAPHLVRAERPPADGSVLGREAGKALAAGLAWGTAAAVDALVRRARRQPGLEHAPVVATGGGADALARLAESVDRVEPWLTHLGLALAARSRPGAP